MDYIKQINAFERWCDSNYLPPLSQLLWYKLFKLNNRLGWDQWVQIDNLRLMVEIQVRREATLIGLRDKLLDAKLIEYKKGHKGSPNKYKIIDTTQKNTFTSEVKTEVYPVVYPAVNSVANTADIYKLNKTKPNNNITTTRAPEHENEGLGRVMSAYFDQIDPAPSERSLAQLHGYCERMGAECCLEAINEAVEKGARNWKYIQAVLATKQRQGVTCIADWRRVEAQRLAAKPQKSGTGRSSFTEIAERMRTEGKI